MVSDTTAWPRKTRELRSQLLDSSVWNEFRFRPDDVVIATHAKAGTTWTQQIVAQLIFGGRDGLDVATLSPWLDLRVPPKEVKLRALEAQRHRRFIKTHLPVDALVFSPEAKYIYVGRDGRDVVWSLYNHHASVSDDWYRWYNDTPGRVGPPLGPPPASIRQYFLEWLERDGHPFWSFWDNVSSWWAIRHLPNVLFLHFADLKRDLPGQMRRVAAFLEIELDKMALCGRAALRLRLHEGARGEACAAPRPLLQGRRPDLHPQRDERPLARRPERGGLPPLRSGGGRAPRQALRALARRGRSAPPRLPPGRLERRSAPAP
jgi:aryl sulfotransferase